MRSWRTSAELQLVHHVHSLHSASIVLSLPRTLFPFWRPCPTHTNTLSPQHAEYLHYSYSSTINQHNLGHCCSQNGGLFGSKLKVEMVIKSTHTNIQDGAAEVSRRNAQKKQPLKKVNCRHKPTR